MLGDRSHKDHEGAGGSGSCSGIQLAPHNPFGGSAGTAHHFELEDEVELRMEMIGNGEQKTELVGKITSKAWDDDRDVASDLTKRWLHQGPQDRERCSVAAIWRRIAPANQNLGHFLDSRSQQAFHETCSAGSRPAVVLRLHGLSQHRVRDLQAKDSGSNFFFRPPFSLVFSYEYQLRKRMAHLMNDGMSLKDAMKMAMECSETREVHFLAPLWFASVPASSSNHGPERSRSPRRLARGDRGKRGKSKGKGKGSGKWNAGNQKGEGKGLHAETPDGRMICFDFDKRSGCPGHCGFVHVWWAAVGTSLSSSFCGPQADKGGGWLDARTYRKGLSEGRAAWIQTWATEQVMAGSVSVQSLSEGLGRLCFASGPAWMRPFEGPFHAWTSACPPGAFLPLPAMLKLILDRGAHHFAALGLLQVAPPRWVRSSGSTQRRRAMTWPCGVGAWARV